MVSRAALGALAKACLRATALVSAIGCAPLAPPPLFARLAGAGRDERGTITLTAAVGLGLAGRSGGMGFELRGRWQAVDDVALGAGFGAAWGDGDPDETVETTRIMGLRIFGVANPGGEDALALAFGAGFSGTNTGQRSVSLDVGAMTSGTLWDTVEPSLGLAAAVAIPVDQGRPFGPRDAPELPTTTFYYGGNVGLGIHLASTRNVLSGETGLLFARSISGQRATALYLAAADAQGVKP